MMHLCRLRVQCNLTFSIIKAAYSNKPGTKFNLEHFQKITAKESLVNKYSEKVLYNCQIEALKFKKGAHRNRAHAKKLERTKQQLEEQVIRSKKPIPYTLKHYLDNVPVSSEINETEDQEFDGEEDKVVQFPLNQVEVSTINELPREELQEDVEKTPGELIDYEVRERNRDKRNWMSGYANYAEEVEESEEWDGSEEINYGTPDPSSKMTNVPCGGCGALLHCKDTSIPGYLPSEIIKNCYKKGGTNLQALICQRCYFLKNYNTALQVRVSPEDYPKVLLSIQNRRSKALIVLMVDLLDFPCSIWPGLADIIGRRTPIVLVGNKIDLIPMDRSKDFFNMVKQRMLQEAKLQSFAMSQIVHTALISAKTGYGIEDLITNLHRIWKHQGDVYLVGCTNVGKSTLFNTLLKSDYCKIQSQDLIQRATTSQWPGTTLNLLKFPITRPSGFRLFMRHERMKHLNKIEAQERQLRKEQLQRNNSVKTATLWGHIGHTYASKEQSNSLDKFTVSQQGNAFGIEKMGINEKATEYKLSRWCFDTPGVVHEEQILHLLTAEEIMMTLPKQLIRPATFCIKPGFSLFIAGLARLDYVEGHKSIRLTVFRANELPVTICPTSEADKVYEEFLHETDFLKVPLRREERLKQWPGLTKAKDFVVRGKSWDVSTDDVVLSNAGWIAINCGPNKEYRFTAWTPEKRGCFVRNSLLPSAVQLRGPRILKTPAYKAHKFV